MSYAPTRQDVYALVREVIESAKEGDVDNVTMCLDIAREQAQQIGMKLPQKRLQRVEEIAYEIATKDALARVEYYISREPREALISHDEAKEYINHTGKAARKSLQEKLRDANRLIRPVKRDLAYNW